MRVRSLAVNKRSEGLGVPRRTDGEVPLHCLVTDTVLPCSVPSLRALLALRTEGAEKGVSERADF